MDMLSEELLFMNKKYNFTSNAEVSGRFVACPKCHEQLSPYDIEVFLSCPYCAANLERTMDIDDFVVEPMVQNWIAHFSQTRPDGRPNR